jgi:hypothetical protein
VIPVQQTKFGAGNGNCLLAAVASVLERPLEEIPDFNLSGCGWFEDLYEWCLNEGIGLIKLNPSQQSEVAVFGCYGVVSVKVHGHDELHAVVAEFERGPNQEHPDGLRWTWEAVHRFDPNPNRLALGEADCILIFVPPPSPRRRTGA